MRSMNESQNPLLANEEPWEDNEDDSRGELAQKKAFSLCETDSVLHDPC